MKLNLTHTTQQLQTEVITGQIEPGSCYAEVSCEGTKISEFYIPGFVFNFYRQHWPDEIDSLTATISQDLVEAAKVRFFEILDTSTKVLLNIRNFSTVVYIKYAEAGFDFRRTEGRLFLNEVRTENDDNLPNRITSELKALDPISQRTIKTNRDCSEEKYRITQTCDEINRIATQKFYQKDFEKVNEDWVAVCLKQSRSINE